MITFTTEPHKTIENVFNNQVYEFSATNGVSCVIVITEGINVREVVIDGINGSFYVDLKKTIQSLFNIDNFQDTKVPTPITWLINDTSLYREYTIDFYVTLANATIETAQRIQKYSKAVDQITKPVEVENTTFKVLSNSRYYNYYEGLPFDISIYSNANRTVTITNTRTGISTSKAFTIGVNRLYLSNGENTLGFENLVPLVLNKINQIEFFRILESPVNIAFTAGAGTLAIGTYYYRVTAINANGETLPSTETSITLGGIGGVNVNWSSVPDATGYKIYGRTTGAELLIATVGDVNTYLDDGSVTPTGAMPIANTTDTLLETIEVYKHEECDAPYLKWFNAKGGYSYFRFLEIYQQPRAHSNREFLNNDFKNVEDTIGNFKTTGKDASESLILSTGTLYDYDIDNFKDLFTSPKVYFYATRPNQPMTSVSFKEVSIANGNFNFDNTKRNTEQYQVIVDLPNLYTQTYR